MKTNNEFIIEENVEFYDKNFFGDEKAHEYDCKCYDGYAICINPTEKKKRFRVKYPLKKEVLSSAIMSNQVLEYRGLFDLTKEDIHFGDIMMVFGTIDC